VTKSPVRTDDEIEPLERLDVASTGPEQTQAIAVALADLVRNGDLLILTGDLGAGKTCFTQGLGRGLGVEQPITSPTFTLANQYRGRLLLHHLDVYRLDSVAETLDLDLPDLLESGVTVIEWGDQISEVLPADHLLVVLHYPEIEASNARGTEVGHSGDFEQYDDRVIEFVAKGIGWQSRLGLLADSLGVGGSG